MKRIASFEVDHNQLLPGMYISRVDGDVATYDLRFVRPNTPPYMEPPAMHTIEHLFATYVRNSQWADQVIYFGPMGCRTGFYFLTRGLPEADVIGLVRETLGFIADFEGEIPGSRPEECGNYREHDLAGAREWARKMAGVLENWTIDQLSYTFQKVR